MKVLGQLEERAKEREAAERVLEQQQQQQSGTQERGETTPPTDFTHLS